MRRSSPPEDGVITTVTAEAGQVVAAGQAGMQLAREDEREVAISVPENRLGELRTREAARRRAVGEPAEDLCGARPRNLAGGRPGNPHVRRARSSLDADAVAAMGDDGQRRSSGARAGANRVLPLTALYQQDGKPAVWVFDPATQKVALRPVGIGPYREDGVVV